MCPQVQDIVVGNKNFTDVTKPSEIVQLLLNEDQMASLEDRTDSTARLPTKGTEMVRGNELAARDLWNEEGDEFFGHSGPSQSGPNAGLEPIDDEGTPVPSSTRGKKRRGDAGTRGRKTGGRGGRKKVNAMNSSVDT